jgi:copper chaperone CopZ
MNQTAIYLTPGISTGHCRAAISEELARLDGIKSTVVDLEARLVRVTAEQTDDAAVIAAIDAVGYEAVRAQAPKPDSPLSRDGRGDVP